MRAPRAQILFRCVLALAGLAFVVGGTATGLGKVRNRLVVENRSGQPIVRLVVSFRSVPIATFKNLPDGGEGLATFQIHDDNSFDLDGALSDGTRLGGNFGDVTTGNYGTYPHFVVRPGGQVGFTD